VALGYGGAHWIGVPGAAPSAAPSPRPAPAVAAAPAPAAAPATPPARPEAAIVPAAATVSAPAQAVPVPAEPADSIDARTAAGRELLGSGSPARYSVQLMVTDARERAYLESYLSEAARVVEPGQIFLVPSGTPQSPRLGVLFGRFEARAQAADALATLPASLRQFKPYVRSIDALRDEARRAQGT